MLSQTLTGVIEPAHHGPFGYSQPFRQLPIGEAVQMLQGDQLPILRRQSEQSPFQRQQFLGREAACRRQNLSLNLPQAVHLKPLAAGEQLEATVSENRVEPGIKLAAMIEPAERLKRVEKRLLNRVQGVFTVAHNSQRVADRTPLIFLNQVSKGFPITRQTLLYSRRVIHHCLSLTYISAAWKIFNCRLKKSDPSGRLESRQRGKGVHNALIAA